MKKGIISTWIGLSLLLGACEFESYDDYQLPEYDGRFVWEQVVKHADWENRIDHAAVVFNGKIWIVGGYNPGENSGDTYYEDVWSSNDGEHWILENEDAPFKGRRGHGLVVFNDGSQDAMYLIGGFCVNEANGHREYRNDVWKSFDGISWTEVKVQSEALDDQGQLIDWYPRMNHGCVVAEHNGQKYMYIIGGFSQIPDVSGRYSMEYFNDVWRSTDGVTCENLPNNDYGIRAEQAIAVEPGTNKIYMQGGSHGVVFDSEFGSSHPTEDWNQVWSSEDGITWTPEIDSTFNQAYLWRVDHQMIFYHGSMWVLPGKNNSNVHYHFTYDSNFPIWFLDEYKNWWVDSEGDAFDARHAYATVVFQDKVWILGGFTNRNGQANDVWAGTIN